MIKAFPGRLMNHRPTKYWKKSCFRKINPVKVRLVRCLTLRTFVRNCFGTELPKNSSGRSTARCVGWMARNLSCTHNSATTSNRMSRNVEPPCISHENRESRWKSTGPEIRLTSSILTPVRSPMRGSL